MVQCQRRHDGMYWPWRLPPVTGTDVEVLGFETHAIPGQTGLCPLQHSRRTIITMDDAVRDMLEQCLREEAFTTAEFPDMTGRGDGRNQRTQQLELRVTLRHEIATEIHERLGVLLAPRWDAGWTFRCHKVAPACAASLPVLYSDSVSVVWLVAWSHFLQHNNCPRWAARPAGVMTHKRLVQGGS